jgi:SnoaL-like protein
VTATTLAERVAIADLVASLAHAQDDRDWTTFRGLFADPMKLDLSGQSGHPPEWLTAGELTAKAQAALDGFACTHHASSNLLVDLVGNTADCRAHMVAYHQLPTDGIDYCVMRGYWKLGLFKVNGRWFIRQWAVVRTAPWEGDPDVYRIAAERN